MELYILDDVLRRTAVIDRFESLIWTERFSSYGDFELVIHSTLESRNLLSIGTFVAVNESSRVMVIDTYENKDDSEGRSLITITGRSYEAILIDRVARISFAGLTAVPTWKLTGTPRGIVTEIFHKICIANTLQPSDNIPFINDVVVSEPYPIGETPPVIDIEFEPTSVYQIIKEICDAYDMGFRIERGLDTSVLYFNTYVGEDKTTSQSIYAPVVFSPDLDNLSDITELSSVALSKNVAYVFNSTYSVIVYAQGADANTRGFDRRVLYVKVEDVDGVTGAASAPYLTQKGNEELSKHRSIIAFDGEVPQNSSYRYGVHYALGDLVEMRNSDGITNQMRVTEQIFVSDTEGERSYPTLAIDLLITPGSWLSWDGQEVWDNADGVWDDQ